MKLHANTKNSIRLFKECPKGHLCIYVSKFDKNFTFEGLTTALLHRLCV